MTKENAAEKEISSGERGVVLEGWFGKTVVVLGNSAYFGLPW